MNQDISVAERLDNAFDGACGLIETIGNLIVWTAHNPIEAIAIGLAIAVLLGAGTTMVGAAGGGGSKGGGHGGGGHH